MIPHQLAKRLRGAGHVTGSDESPVLPVAEEIVCGADPVGKDEREPAGGCLVHDHGPRLPLGQESEDICRDVELDDALPVDVADEHEANRERVREVGQCRALRAFARYDEQEPRIVGRSHGAHEHVEALLRRQPRDREHDDVLRPGSKSTAQLRTTAREPVGARAERLDVDRVREDPHPLGMSAARDHRVSRERARDEQAGGALDDRRNHCPLHRSAPPGPPPLVVALDDEQVWDVLQSAPRDRGLRGEGAPAGDDHDVGVYPGQRPNDARRHGVVVVEHSPRARNAETAQEHRLVPRLDTPRAPCNRSRGVDHGEVDPGAGRDAVEQRGAIRRGLREDGGNAYGSSSTGVGDPLDPAFGLTTGRRHRSAFAPPGRDVYGQGRIEAQRAARDSRTSRRRRGARQSHQVTCRERTRT